MPRVVHRDLDGNETVTEYPDEEMVDPVEAARAAAATARQAVSGYSESNGQRRAVEALAAAVESLTGGGS